MRMLTEDIPKEGADVSSARHDADREASFVRSFQELEDWHCLGAFRFWVCKGSRRCFVQDMGCSEAARAVLRRRKTHWTARIHRTFTFNFQVLRCYFAMIIASVSSRQGLQFCPESLALQALATNEGIEILEAGW